MLSLRPRPQHGLDIAVLDVGQGDGIVLLCEGGESKSGGIIWLDEERRERHRETVILIDGGSTSDKQVGKNRLEPYLKSQGISRIDVAVVSHGDEDHISGLRYLLTAQRYALAVCCCRRRGRKTRAMIGCLRRQTNGVSEQAIWMPGTGFRRGRAALPAFIQEKKWRLIFRTEISNPLCLGQTMRISICSLPGM